MGLDTVYLVMEIEKEFGITIPDFALSEIRTVGDLVDFCLARIHASKTTGCPALSCFRSLQSVVREVKCDLDFKIRLRDEIDLCLSESERKRLWQRLPELLKSSPRELRRPPWLRKTLVLIVLGFPILLMVCFPWLIQILLLIGLATIALGIILHWSTIGFRTRTPEGYHTFGDITKHMMGLSIATNPPAETDYDSVFAIVKKIIIEELGVDEADVVPTARFIEDLGAD